MPTFTKVDQLSNIFGWANLDRYEVSEQSGKRMVLTYDQDRAGPYDAETNAWQIRIDIHKGMAKTVTWLDNDGDGLARLSGGKMDADLLRAFLDPQGGRAGAVYQTLLHDGATFVGAPVGRQGGGNNDLTTSLWDDKVRSVGNSYIKDMGGTDLYIGSDGYNEVTYDNWWWERPESALRGIDADLQSGKKVGPDGMTDKLRGFWEGVRGTFLDDTIRGAGTDEDFQGMRGADLIDGRGGTDRVSYRNDADQGGEHGVKINLAKGFAKDGFGDRDRVISIERAEGTAQKDRFIDGKGDNGYQGRAGNDVFILAAGNDWASGGDGGDRFVFKGRGFEVDIIDDFDASSGDRIKMTAAQGPRDIAEIAQEGADTVIRLDADNEVWLRNFDSSGIAATEFILF